MSKHARVFHRQIPCPYGVPNGVEAEYKAQPEVEARRGRVSDPPPSNPLQLLELLVHPLANLLDACSGGVEHEVDVVHAGQVLEALLDPHGHLFHAATVDAGRCADLLCRTQNLSNRFGVAGILLTRALAQPHGPGQVVGTDEAGVHARHGEDLLSVLDPVAVSYTHLTLPTIYSV